MERVAKCHCGSLSVVASGEPSPVLMCHCELCQRRTGTSYNLGAWYPETDISIQGETKLYARTGDTNSLVKFYFCPNCGSNVFWKAPEIQPGKVAVAVGCFADPEFPAPTLSLFGTQRHSWITMPEEVPSFGGGRGSDEE